MQQANTRVIRSEELPLGGFAGIVETRIVMNPRIWPEAGRRDDISYGLGDFIYTAIGHFKPNDGAPMHPHENVDIVTLVSTGEIGHEGTNGGGTVIKAPGVQVQRAGRGMMHSEFSTNPAEADFVQLWFLPPRQGLEPDYRNFELDSTGKLQTVLGGRNGTCFDSEITCQIGYINSGESFTFNTRCIAIVFDGSGQVNGMTSKRGDLFETSTLLVTSKRKLGLIVISETSK
jgi:quercetin 2,3-dioxygenase